MQTTTENKREGAHFEAMLVHRATLTGIWAHKHELSFRYLRQGKILPIRSELDFALFNREGQCCFVDCKSFAGKSFARSALNAAQLARSVRYCEHNVPSGFLVYLRGSGLVSFFPGWLIQRAAKGTSFKAEHGRILGPFQSFSLSLVFNEFRADFSTAKREPPHGTISADRACATSVRQAKVATPGTTALPSARKRSIL